MKNINRCSKLKRALIILLYQRNSLQHFYFLLYENPILNAQKRQKMQKKQLQKIGSSRKKSGSSQWTLCSRIFTGFWRKNVSFKNCVAQDVQNRTRLSAPTAYTCNVCTFSKLVDLIGTKCECCCFYFIYFSWITAKQILYNHAQR